MVQSSHTARILHHTLLRSTPFPQANRSHSCLDLTEASDDM